jgi:pyridoxal phosphate enzyme (YggS family)
MQEANRIKENLKKIRKNISQACNRVGRDPDSVKLLVASKYADSSQLKNIYGLGLREFGENRAQSLVEKYKEVDKDAIWHFIGHLQTNKIKKVVPIAECIHSIDSIRTVEALDMYCKKVNKIQKILIEINISGEESKHGLKTADVNNFFKDALKYSNVSIMGLMTMAPFAEDERTLRSVFKNLSSIKKELEAKNTNLKLAELSMGMSNDYIIAIEEGSTIIRIGSAIFS